MTYGEVFKEFVSVTGIAESAIVDWRPCDEMFDVPTIPGAIVLWLKGGHKLIYIRKEDKDEK